MTTQTTIDKEFARGMARDVLTIKQKFEDIYEIGDDPCVWLVDDQLTCAEESFRLIIDYTQENRKRLDLERGYPPIQYETFVFDATLDRSLEIDFDAHTELVGDSEHALMDAHRDRISLGVLFSVIVRLHTATRHSYCPDVMREVFRKAEERMGYIHGYFAIIEFTD